MQTFDLAGNRTGPATLGTAPTSMADFTNQYTYDRLNRLTRVTQAGVSGGNAVAEKRVDFSYTADSQPATVTRYQDLAGTKLVAASTYTYDPVGRLQALTHRQNTATLAGYTWTYDTANRVSTFTDALHPAESAAYTYDLASQLTAADRPGTTADETYTYDPNGNRSNYTTGADNRLKSDGTYAYTYDREGNRTRRTHLASGEVTDYTWDHRNRLIRVTTRSTDHGPLTTDISYTYDVFDRRVAKQVDLDGAAPQPPTKEFFLYDAEHIALTFLDPDASDPQPAVLTHRYLHGPAVDQILADEQLTSPTTSGNTVWPLPDNLGTIRDLADFNETTNLTRVVNHLTYDTFGRITAETTAAIDFLFAYTGRERDEETNIYYYRARYYDPAVGRFLTPDLITFDSGDANLYRYAENNATNATDASGLEKSWWQEDTWAGWGLNPWSWPILREVPNLLGGYRWAQLKVTCDELDQAERSRASAIRGLVNGEDARSRYQNSKSIGPATKSLIEDASQANYEFLGSAGSFARPGTTSGSAVGAPSASLPRTGAAKLGKVIRTVDAVNPGTLADDLARSFA